MMLLATPTAVADATAASGFVTVPTKGAIAWPEIAAALGLSAGTTTGAVRSDSSGPGDRVGIGVGGHADPAAQHDLIRPLPDRIRARGSAAVAIQHPLLGPVSSNGR
ncbi:hypothetical protein [Dactylosporangium sp. NPDC048998]|uniref:hypothetical protein n=1 Tax=Dactylosporangium sp. NPDC048998 TaxID=3363976 RepID=UPI003713AB65